MSESTTILVVDDDADVLTAARLLLRRHFARVLTTSDPAEIESMMNNTIIDVFLLDMNFAIGSNSGEEGLHWLGRIRALDTEAVVVLMTAFGDLNMAVRAMREGAADFVLKPWQNEKLLATLRVAAALRQSRVTIDALSEPQPANDLVVGSNAMQAVMRVVDRAAPTEANVLIQGENGTGKGLIADAIHRRSERANKMLVTVDLGAVAESLFESELFGHVKGAFTGAHRDRAGRVQAAHGGTLFLDEIGNLPLALQTKLLRALETGEITPVGSDRSITIDVRLICATNRPLAQMVDENAFRADLLYRINTIEIGLPPLRDRIDELPVLVEHLVALQAKKYRQPAKAVSAAALESLAQHSWPGNVRELSHAVERALILSDGDMLDANDFMLSLTTAPNESLNLEANERHTIQTALERHTGNISHAAQALGITRAALYRRIEKFNL